MISIICNEIDCRWWQGDTFARALSDVFSDLGYQNEVVTVPKKRPGLMIVVGVKNLCARLKRFNCPIVLYSVDPIYVIRANRFCRGLMEFGFSPRDLFGVIDFSPIDRVGFRRIGIRRWVFAPVGYHRFFEVLNAPIDEKYDVGFLGNLSERRKKVIAEIESSFSVDKNRTDDVGLFLGKSSILIHIIKDDYNFNFAAFRIIQLGLSNARFVISEPSCWAPNGIESGVHLVVAKRDDLVGSIRWAINNPEERSRIAKSGHEWVKSSYCLIDNFRKPMEEVLSWI